MHPHPQQAWPKIPSSVNLRRTVAIDSLRSIYCSLWSHIRGMKETPRRRIAVTSSLNKISMQGNQLGNRVVVRGGRR